MKIVITDRCTGCGVCISRCSNKAIEFSTKDYIKRGRCSEDKCTLCKECIPHCGFQAIQIMK